MNPCELVAKLNPGSPRLDGGGRGGVPEYTAQDVAAALGMVRDTFAREVFCAVWWPDGARLVERELDQMIGAEQFGQWKERADAITVAQIAEAQAGLEPMRTRAASEHRAELMLAKARADMWPALGNDAYPRIRKAAIKELRATRTCSECNGRRQLISAGLVISCNSCAGTGRIAVSDWDRAEETMPPQSFGEEELTKADRVRKWYSTYRRSWKDVYEWTYQLLLEANARGRVEFLACLGLDEAA